MCICEAAHGKKVYTEAEVHQRIKEAGFANDEFVNRLKALLADHAEHKGE